jgi:response regulator RpfG family c-di-GMP phosphodiesterase
VAIGKGEDVKVLLVEDNSEKASLISSSLIKEIYCEVESVGNATDAVDKLGKENSWSVVLCRNIIEEEEVAKKLLNYIYDNGLSIPFVSLGDLDLSGFKYAVVPPQTKINKMISIVIKEMGITREELAEMHLPDYVPFALEYFYALDNAICDVFLRIPRKSGDDQYIKRVKENDELDREGIKKYEAQGVSELYVTKEDRERFISAVTMKNSDAMENASSTEEKIEATQDSYDVVKSMIADNNFSEEAIHLANKSIDTIKKTIAENKSVKDLIRGIISDKNSYSYQHTFLIPLVTYQMLGELQWEKGDMLKGQFDTIAFISFFHDIVLTEDRFVKINNKEQFAAADLTDKERELIKTHANEASTLVQKIPNAPLGADVIIRQHHGDPNGIGYPENYSGHLSSLAIVFIVVEEFVGGLLEGLKSGHSMADIIKTLESRFTLPSYKKILDAIGKTFVKK